MNFSVVAVEVELIFLDLYALGLFKNQLYFISYVYNCP